MKGKVSKTGYKRTSPDRNNDYNIIPSGRITMQDVDFPVYGVDEYGNSQMMYPGAEYQFPGNQVFELPIKQEGGERDPEMIFRDKYNTLLKPAEERKFNRWAAKESKRQGRDILMDMGAYDVRGFWKSGDYKRMDQDNHGSDTWKKPNHPTFSNQSRYHGADGWYGGNWTENGGYQPSKQTLQLYTPDYYKWMFGTEPNRPEHLDMSRYESGINTPTPMYYQQGGDLEKFGSGGLNQWFDEKWIDVKTGEECGRSGKDKDGRPYPACRPSRRVNETTPKTTSELSSSEKAKFKREKTSGKRIDYNHKRAQEGIEVEPASRRIRYEDGRIKLQDPAIYDGMLDETTVTPYTQSELAWQESRANLATGALDPIYPIFEVLSSGAGLPLRNAARTVTKKATQIPANLMPTYRDMYRGLDLDGTSSYVLKNAQEFKHVSKNPNLRFVDIKTTDPIPIGRRPKAGRRINLNVAEGNSDPRNALAGFYTTAVEKEIGERAAIAGFPRADQSVYKFSMPEGTRVLELPGTTIMSTGNLKEAADMGYDLIRGNDYGTGVEYIPLNKNKMMGFGNSSNPIKAYGGSIPKAQNGKETSWSDYINPMNWGVSTYDDAGTFNQAFAKARGEGQDEFMWYGNRYNTQLAPQSEQTTVNDTPPARPSDDIDLDFNALKKGVSFVESRNGKYMWNPESSATGLYGQRFSEIGDTPLYGGTRENFRDDTEAQERVFGIRYNDGLPGSTSLKKDAIDLYREYYPIVKKNNIAPTELAALSNFLGRQGTRYYLGYVLRDGKNLSEVFPKLYGDNVAQKNKTPEEYLKLFREAAYAEEVGGEVEEKYPDYSEYDTSSRAWMAARKELGKNKQFKYGGKVMSTCTPNGY